MLASICLFLRIHVCNHISMRDITRTIKTMRMASSSKIPRKHITRESKTKRCTGNKRKEHGNLNGILSHLLCSSSLLYLTEFCVSKYRVISLSRGDCRIIGITFGLNCLYCRIGLHVFSNSCINCLTGTGVYSLSSLSISCRLSTNLPLSLIVLFTHSVIRCSFI